MSVEDHRRRIDEIDELIVGLLSERAQCAARIGGVKRRNGTAVRDEAREREILRKIATANRGPLGADALRRIYEAIIAACRELETDGA